MSTDEAELELQFSEHENSNEDPQAEANSESSSAFLEWERDIGGGEVEVGGGGVLEPSPHLPALAPPPLSPASGRVSPY